MWLAWGYYSLTSGLRSSEFSYIKFQRSLEFEIESYLLGLMSNASWNTNLQGGSSTYWIINRVNDPKKCCFVFSPTLSHVLNIMGFLFSSFRFSPFSYFDANFSKQMIVSSWFYTEKRIKNETIDFSGRKYHIFFNEAHCLILSVNSIYKMRCFPCVRV